jgi:hypothetical protein
MEKTNVVSKEVFIKRRRYLIGRGYLRFSNVILYGCGIGSLAGTPENRVTFPRPFNKMLGFSSPLYIASNALL